MDKNILIVEDEIIIAMDIKSYLSQQGYNIVDICTNADDAYKRALKNDVNLIMMDIYLANGGDGIKVMSKIRERKDTPVVFLTAYTDEDTIERVSKIKFSNFLTKPYRRSELLASIKIALNHATCDKHIILDDEFSFNTQTHELIYNGKIVNLNNQQRTLLKLFLKNKNQLITYEAIEHEIWSDKPCSNSTRMALVSKLRKKLHGKFIETYSLEGYIFKLKS